MVFPLLGLGSGPVMGNVDDWQKVSYLLVGK
jgi:hypothetical protein